MKAVVTVKVKLADFSDVLDRTMRVFSKAVQLCVNTAWTNHIQSRNRLHEQCYYPLRETFGLQAQLTINAIKQALEMVKGAKSKPEVSDVLSIRYNFPRCASITGDWAVLSLTTIDGRVKFQITIPKYFEKYLNWEIRESTLIKDFKGRFFFCFVFSKEVDIQIGNSGYKILGVDLGVNTLAVTSEGTFFGSVKSKRIQWERFMAELQAKGTSATRKKLKKAGNRWKRFMTWMNHTVSKQIVDTLSKGDVLVMEDLTNIRQTAKYNRWVHKWAFRELQHFLEYKASLKGIRMVYVDPRNTSKACNRCHSLRTRRNRGFFECRVCGHTLNADLNGARNIARRYRRMTGLGLGKQSQDLPCNEDKANLRLQVGIEAEHRQKLLP